VHSASGADQFWQGKSETMRRISETEPTPMNGRALSRNNALEEMCRVVPAVAMRIGRPTAASAPPRQTATPAPVHNKAIKRNWLLVFACASMAAYPSWVPHCAPAGYGLRSKTLAQQHSVIAPSAQAIRASTRMVRVDPMLPTYG
jgi:hypothetical protein